MLERFQLDGRVAVITGGGGLLGREHAAAIANAGGIPVLADLNGDAARRSAREVTGAYPLVTDVTDPVSVRSMCAEILAQFGRVDILINNAANNPQVSPEDVADNCRLETFDLDVWNRDVTVGLTGAFLCSQVMGREMAQRSSGVIVNVASDLAVIAPDQRIYRQSNLPAEAQPVKPVSYSVVKSGLIGLTRYLATYWAEDGVRVNAISPGGVDNGQPSAFVEKLTTLIPLGRMAQRDEYREAIVFLCSDASSYMTGQNLVIDGGRTVW